MKKWKEAIRRTIYPHPVLTILLIICAFIILKYTSNSEKSDSLIGYFSYAFSFYVLVILVCRIFTFIKHLTQAVQQHALANRLLTDMPFRIQFSLGMSLFINGAYAIIKLVSGVFYLSIWFITISIYYILLCAIRFLLLTHARRFGQDKSKREEYRQYRRCGILLIIVNVALSIMSVQIVRNHQGYKYPGTFVYVVALYTFYAVIVAGVNWIRYRKYDSPIISAAQALNFMTALVSILSLQTAMLAQFNTDPNYEKVMTGITSCAICIIIIGIAFYMIAKSTLKLHDLSISATSKSQNF